MTDLPSLERQRRLRTMIVCFLAFNLAMGLAFASFGPLLPLNEAHFHVSRASAATGMSMLLLAFALTSPVAGWIVGRTTVRGTMMAAALLTAAGYLGVAFAPNYPLALAMYALIGAGVSILSVTGPVTLVARWLEQRRGAVLSLVCLPVVLSVGPFLLADLIPKIGREHVLVALAVLLLLLIPVLALIVERPAGQVVDEAAKQASARTSPADILRSPGFWILSIAIGNMAGAGIAFMVHIVPFGLERGLTLAQASGLISVSAVAGLVATPLSGWLADRLGPPIALALATAGGAVLWSCLVGAPSDRLILVAAGLGACSNPLNTLQGAALTALFGPDRVSEAIGYSYLVNLPFMFGYAPLVAVIYEATGGYRWPFTACGVLLACSSAMFLGMALLVRAQQAQLARTARATS